MNLFTIYILKQLLGPFLLFMIAMTGIAWLTQSLRFIELIIIKGLPIIKTTSIDVNMASPVLTVKYLKTLRNEKIST